MFNYLAYWGNGFHNKGYFSVDEIVLPVGISFYTFQTISYTVDIYRRKLKSLDSILDFGLYVTFFPQLVAGPIVRAEEFVPQILRPTQITQISLITAGNSASAAMLSEPITSMSHW